MKKTILFCSLLLLVVSAVWAQIPQTISYQGLLKNADGTQVTDDTYTITFKLYDVSSGDTPLWTEEQSVSVSDGILNVILGSINPLDLPFDKQYWLGITIGDGSELTPRMKLTSSAYSMNAQSVADGQIVKSINDIKDDVTFAEGENISISKSGNTLTISSDVEGGLSLPYSGEISTSGTAFSIFNEGGGPAGFFRNDDPDNYTHALYGSTNSNGYGIMGYNSGNGGAGFFQIDNISNDHSVALWVNTNGSGDAFWANTSGDGYAGYFSTIGNGYAGYFEIGNTGNNRSALYAKTNGTGRALSAETSGAGSALQAVATENGWAGAFFAENNSNGVYISAPYGKTGLNVSGGTKNAIVPTSHGSRALYTEESTEVWFSDYGFNSLENGNTIITIDPLFAETVNLENPYHVFVQPYGNADLYVTERTPVSFEVHGREGESNVEFSYRIVAKRSGYEETRLEHAPFADDDPNLYPEKRAIWEAKKISPETRRTKFLEELEKQRNKFNNK